MFLPVFSCVFLLLSPCYFLSCVCLCVSVTRNMTRIMLRMMMTRAQIILLYGKHSINKFKVEFRTKMISNPLKIKYREPKVYRKILREIFCKALYLHKIKFSSALLLKIYSKSSSSSVLLLLLLYLCLSLSICLSLYISLFSKKFAKNYPQLNQKKYVCVLSVSEFFCCG